MPISGEHREKLLGVARAAIRGTLSNGARPTPPPPLPDGDGPLRQNAGCFVSLHELETRRLRGCVGRLEAREPLILAVHDAAINVLRDPRFCTDAITLDELPRLDLELTVLSLLQAVQHCLDFEPAVHGIYLTINGRGGCFLPQVARDTGWGRQQLLERLCTEKMDLPSDAWKTPAARLFTFTAEIVGPEPFEPGSFTSLFPSV